jgi:FkbM family methyltransferase
VKSCLVNNTWEIIAPDHIADWDAVTGWEIERIRSMMDTLQPGDVLYEIGAEHGWMAALFAQRVGGANVALVEPSPDLWPNIRKCWSANGYPSPLATIEAFCSEVNVDSPSVTPWPESSIGDECPTLAYRSLPDHDQIPSITIDRIVDRIGVAPKAISVDVEGAELHVLRGARRTLKQDKPWVWLSVHPDLMEKWYGHRPRQIKDVLRAAGYSHRVLGVDHEQHWLCWPTEWGPQ